MAEAGQYLYAGLSGVELPESCVEFGEGVELKQTYAHLMSPCLMAFAPPGPQGFHPAPWKAAKGGYGFDIHIEMRVPNSPIFGSNLEPKETIWWIAALLRIARVPFLTVSTVSNLPFDVLQESGGEGKVEPFETQPRMLRAPETTHPVIPADALAWVKEKWFTGGKLLNANPSFYSVIKAFDAATISGKTSSSLLGLWGGIEQIFSPSPGELRHRVSSYLASYLEPPGESRLKLYKEILALYNQRSAAAHRADEIGYTPLLGTYVLMRNALVRMIDENVIPTQDELEKRLFCCI